MIEFGMSAEERQRFYWILEEAGIESAVLSPVGVQVLALLARSDPVICAGLRDLVAAAHQAGYAAAEEEIERYEAGVPFFRHDATVSVTVSASELASWGMPDDAVIGVCWEEPGDECIAHAIAGAAVRAAQRPDDRGLLIYRGWRLDCWTCAAAEAGR